MSKFKKGDRVRNLIEHANIAVGALGTVDDDNTNWPWVIWDTVKKPVYNLENPNRCPQFEDKMELYVEKQPDDPFGLIGKKMRGFKFNNSDFKCSYNSSMDDYIGKDAEIILYYKFGNSYACKFSDGTTWHYPAELIMEHLITEAIESRELTLLEKFEQGWVIRYKDGALAKHIYTSRSSIDAIVIEWGDGTASMGIDSDFNGYITCTPPRETKTVYLHLRTLTGDCFVSHKILTTESCVLINTITLEKVNGKWQFKKEVPNGSN